MSVTARPPRARAHRPRPSARAASVLYAAASERAAARAEGPGTFAVAFLDALDAVAAEPAELDARVADVLAIR